MSSFRANFYPRKIDNFDLKPEIKKALRWWHPLDHLKLLGWMLFTPPNLLVYLKEHDETLNSAWGIPSQFSQMLRKSPYQHRLLWQSLVLAPLVCLVLALGLGLALRGFSLTMLVGTIIGLGAGFGFGLLVGLVVTFGYTLWGGFGKGKTFGFFWGIVGYLVGILVFSLVGSQYYLEDFGEAKAVQEALTRTTIGLVVAAFVLGLAYSVGGRIVAKVVKGQETRRLVLAGLWFSFALAIGFSLAGGVAREPSGSSLLAIANFNLSGCLIGFASGFFLGWFIFGLTITRAIDWLVVAWPSYLTSIWLRVAAENSSQIHAHNFWAVSRTTLIPLPGWREAIERLLDNNFKNGVAIINQLTVYTAQFVPVSRALNTHLNKVAQEQPHKFLYQINVLVEANLIDLDLLKAVAPNVMLPLWRQFWLNLRAKSAELDESLDKATLTTAQAACRGYWYLYQRQPAKAGELFSALPTKMKHQEELNSVAQALRCLEETKNYDELVNLDKRLTRTETWPEMAVRTVHPLREALVNVFKRVRLIGQEAADSKQLSTSVKQLGALGRAKNELKRLLQDADRFEKLEQLTNREFNALNPEEQNRLQKEYDELRQTYPQPESKLISTALEQWLKVLEEGDRGERIIAEKINNPYTGFGGQPVKGSAFIGRKDIMNQINKWLNNRGALPPLFLYGHRRMGKSSILRNIQHHTDHKTVMVYIDMQRIALGASTADIYYDLADNIYQNAKKENWLVASNQPNPARFSNENVAEARRALTDLLEQLGESKQRENRRLILAIDEFELIQKLINEGKIDRSVLENLRSFAQNYDWLALVFGGAMDLVEMGGDYQNAFYGSSDSIKVSYMNRDEAERLICEPEEEFPLEYEDALIDELCRLTNGQPFLLQRLCHDLVDARNERAHWEADNLERKMKLDDLQGLLNADFYENAEFYFKGVWHQASNDGQLIMREIASSNNGTLSLEELTRRLPRIGNINAALKELAKRDIIIQEPIAKSYYFAAALNCEWVRQKQLVGIS
jgi:ATPase domain predominantly from Archaea